MKKLGCILILLLLAATLAVPQTGDLAPGENLVVEGVPRIPAALAAAVSRYAEFRAATLMSWHPTRREMLISTRFGDTPQVHLVKFPGGARRQLTFFPDRVGDATFHPKGGDYFVFSKDVGGGEWFQKYRFDLATGAITLLTDGKSRNIGGVWSNDGNRLAYGSTRRNGADVDLYVMDPAAPESFNLVSARSTSDVYSLDLGMGKVERWTESETGGLSTESFSQPELVRWKSFDGRMISGFLYRPPARFTGKRPVVINIHGGPEG